jgi:uncharacterized protein (TIGR02646 family)
MRKQNRPELPPEVYALAVKWQQQWDDSRSEVAEENLRTGKNRTASFTWYEHNKKTARDHFLPFLREMNQGHCSFCDAYPIGDRSNEPIEHFQPKGTFPELAFVWTNLYYICEGCNTSKNDNYDPLLIRPDAKDYEFTRYFSFTIRGEIEPNQFAPDTEQSRARVTIQLYALNDSERCRMRLEEFNYRYQQHNPIDFYAYRDFLEFSALLPEASSPE